MRKQPGTPNVPLMCPGNVSETHSLPSSHEAGLKLLCAFRRLSASQMVTSLASEVQRTVTLKQRTWKSLNKLNTVT